MNAIIHLSRIVLMVPWCLAILSDKLVAGDAIDFQRSVVPVLEKYCVDCHVEGANESDVVLDNFDAFKDPSQDAKLWQKVWDAVNARVMPPRKKPQPTDEERALLIGWIERKVFKVDCASPDPGRVTLRRLNRREYNYSVQDLFGIRFEPAEDFPPDDSGYGFDNIADVLTLSPVLMDKYFNAAEQVVAKVVHLGPPLEPVRVLDGALLQIVSEPDAKCRIYEADLDIEDDGQYEFTVDVTVFSFDPFTGETRFRAELDGDELYTKPYQKSFPLGDKITFSHSLTAGKRRLRIINDVATAIVSSKSNAIRFETTRATIRGPAGKKEFPEPHRRLFFKGTASNAGCRRNGVQRQAVQRSESTS